MGRNINTDGSSRGNPGHVGVGVGRDSSRDVQFIFSVYKGLHTNNLMEAQAILSAVERGSQLGWRRIICESDSQVVVNLLNRRHLEDVSWHLVLIVDQILNLCTSLEFVTFTHIPREWNAVADCLAKWAFDHIHDWNLVDQGICGLYERKLKELNPAIQNITYDIEDIYSFIDGLADLSALVLDHSLHAYLPNDRKWIKQQLLKHLKKLAVSDWNSSRVNDWNKW